MEKKYIVIQIRSTEDELRCDILKVEAALQSAVDASVWLGGRQQGEQAAAEVRINI